MQKKSVEKYPFNFKWTNYHFNSYPLPHFINNLYKYRQMEQMWLEKAKEENDYHLIKLCNNNITYLDSKIAYEEDVLLKNKLKNRTSSNNNNNFKNNKFKNQKS